MKYLALSVILLLLFSNLCVAEDINWDKLVDCVIEVESGGNPRAVSKAGAVGLLQITPIVLKEFIDNAGKELYICDFQSGVWYHVKGLNPYSKRLTMKKMYSPSINFKIGEWYLYRLHYHYKCKTIKQILMAYNAGITRCKKVNFDIKKLPNETKNYVKKVLKLYKKN